MKGTPANSVDPDQMPQNSASDQKLSCLLECLRIIRVMNWDTGAIFRQKLKISNLGAMGSGK